MATFLSLPSEVKAQIFGYFRLQLARIEIPKNAFASEILLGEVYGFLLDCVLSISYVCREFADHGRSILFQNIGVSSLSYSPGDLQQEAQLEAVLNYPHLGKYIRYWRLNLAMASGIFGFPPGSEESESVLRKLQVVLKECTQIKALTLVLAGPNDVLELLNALPKGTHFERLEWHDYNY